MGEKDALTPTLSRYSGRGEKACYMKWLLIQLVLLYRVTLGWLLGGQCRFHPSCSQYAIDAITKYGAVSGSWRAIKRICRCHPWGGKGFDPA